MANKIKLLESAPLMTQQHQSICGLPLDKTSETEKKMPSLAYNKFILTKEQIDVQ